MSRTATWKITEKAVAKMLGGERMSNQGLGLAMPDVETSAYSVEVKHKAKIPSWLAEAVDQAHRNASAGKLPLVVLHQSSQRHERDLVVLRMGEFLEWFGSGGCGEIIGRSDRVAGGSSGVNQGDGLAPAKEGML